MVVGKWVVATSFHQEVLSNCERILKISVVTTHVPNFNIV